MSKARIFDWRLYRPISEKQTNSFNQSLYEVGWTVGASVDFFFFPLKEKMAPSSKSEKEDNGNKQKQQRKHKDHVVKLLARGKVIKATSFLSV